MAKNRPPVHTFTLAAPAHLTTSHGHLASVMPSNPLRILVPESLRPSTPARTQTLHVQAVDHSQQHHELFLSISASACSPLVPAQWPGLRHHLASDGGASVTAMDQLFWGHACQTTVAMDVDHWFTGCINGQCQQLAPAFSGICLMSCTVEGFKHAATNQTNSK
jgi:hypothetical protein